MSVHINPVALLTAVVIILAIVAWVERTARIRGDNAVDNEAIEKLRQIITVATDRAARAEQGVKRNEDRIGEGEENTKEIFKEVTVLTRLVSKLIAGDEIDVDRIRLDVEAEFIARDRKALPTETAIQIEEIARVRAEIIAQRST